MEDHAKNSEDSTKSKGQYRKWHFHGYAYHIKKYIKKGTVMYVNSVELIFFIYI